MGNIKFLGLLVGFSSIPYSNVAVGQTAHVLLLNDSNPRIAKQAGSSSDAMSLAIAASVPRDNIEWSSKSGAVNRDSLLTAIDSLRIKSGNSLFFYYCGHGYVNERNAPYILPGGNPEPLYLADILVRVQRLNAKKSIVLFDCCQGLRTTGDGRPEPVLTDAIEPFFQSLFFENPSKKPLSLISSAPGEFALAAHADQLGIIPGSTFSTAFLRVSTKFKKQKLTWNQFFDEVSRQTAIEFTKMREADAELLGGELLSDRPQETQTVTHFRPEEIR